MVKRRERIYLPAGVGGLIRYPEEEEKFFKLKPEHVVFIAILLIIIELLARFLL